MRVNLLKMVEYRYNEIRERLTEIDGYKALNKLFNDTKNWMGEFKPVLSAKQLTYDKAHFFLTFPEEGKSLQIKGKSNEYNLSKSLSGIKKSLGANILKEWDLYDVFEDYSADKVKVHLPSGIKLIIPKSLKDVVLKLVGTYYKDRSKYLSEYKYCIDSRLVK